MRTTGVTMRGAGARANVISSWKADPGDAGAGGVLRRRTGAAAWEARSPGPLALGLRGHSSEDLPGGRQADDTTDTGRAIPTANGQARGNRAGRHALGGRAAGL